MHSAWIIALGSGWKYFTEYLVCVRHCFRHWGFSSEQKPSVPPLMELLQLFFLTTKPRTMGFTVILPNNPVLYDSHFIKEATDVLGREI